ncbi:MAG: 2-dehydro-3-deoxygalactonokinase [Pseudomonadota bacterium]
MNGLSWIAVDWGTSRLRAWAMGRNDGVLAEAASDDGMSAVGPTGFEPALLRLIEPWLSATTIPVLCCGMVGARQGWQEAPYVPVPVKPAHLSPIRVPGTDPRLSVFILPGLSQAAPADVMRGEETQISGFLAADPDFDGVLCLPGTHAKWTRLSAGEVVSFQTAMTGELYQLIAHRSVVRHVLAEQTGALDGAAFDDAVAEALSQPETLAQRLFGLRAGAVLHDVAPDTTRSRLSGLLIGAELASTKPYWLGQAVALAAEPYLAEMYARALAAQGVDVRLEEAGQLTRRGLAAAFQALNEARV